MDCKEALSNAEGDFEAAIDYLRKKGQKVSAKRADRDALEGVVVAKPPPDGHRGVVVRLTSETDFVAKNQDFRTFADEVADVTLNNFPQSVDDLKALKLKDGRSIGDALDEQVAKIGEKIGIGQYERMEAPQVVAYNHGANRIGVLVGLSHHDEKAVQAGFDTAMQIAAMSPVALDRNSVSQATIDRELDIAKEQIRAEGKPENMVEKIAQGKLNKFFKDSTLLSQDFVKDSSKTVEQMLKEINADLKVLDFKRVALGE